MTPVEEGGFGLAPWQVPHPPQSKIWADHLRWCLAVMDWNDGSVAITAGLLSKAVERGEFTPRQTNAAVKIVNRIRDEFSAGTLLCQQEQPFHVVETAAETGTAA